MEIEKTSRTFRIVMIEFVLMLGVFAAMSVIIVRIFLSADHMSRRALDYSKAVIEAENIAERLKGSTSFEAALADMGMEKTTDEGTGFYRGYYEQDWEQSDDTGIYEITVYLERVAGRAGHLEKARITASRVKERIGSEEDLHSLCRLSVSKFNPD